MIVAIKREVLQKLLEDPEWSRKLDEVTTNQEYAKLIKDFAQAKGLKIINVMMPEKTVKGGDTH